MPDFVYDKLISFGSFVKKRFIKQNVQETNEWIEAKELIESKKEK